MISPLVIFLWILGWILWIILVGRWSAIYAKNTYATYEYRKSTVEELIFVSGILLGAFWPIQLAGFMLTKILSKIVETMSNFFLSNTK